MSWVHQYSLSNFDITYVCILIHSPCQRLVSATFSVYHKHIILPWSMFWWCSIFHLAICVSLKLYRHWGNHMNQQVANQNKKAWTMCKLWGINLWFTFSTWCIGCKNPRQILAICCYYRCLRGSNTSLSVKESDLWNEKQQQEMDKYDNFSHIENKLCEITNSCVFK